MTHKLILLTSEDKNLNFFFFPVEVEKPSRKSLASFAFLNLRK